MKSRMLPAVLLFTLLCGAGAAAQESATVWGEISLAPLQADVKGNRAKFNEYRDVGDGVYGRIGIHGEGEKNYFDFQAQDIGRRDQMMEMQGGTRGAFRYELKYDEIPHNFNFGTRLHR